MSNGKSSLCVKISSYLSQLACVEFCLCRIYHCEEKTQRWNQQSLTSTWSLVFANGTHHGAQPARCLTLQLNSANRNLLPHKCHFCLPKLSIGNLCQLIALQKKQLSFCGISLTLQRLEFVIHVRSYDLNGEEFIQFDLERSL